MLPRFENFSKQPFLKTISKKEKWTVSTSKKKPIDMQYLLETQQIRGALFKNGNNPLTTLNVVNETIPDAVNRTFYLDCITDGIIILDIEPVCPQELKNQFLSYPCLYAEKSMSGKGIHMVFALPKCFYDYPIAQKKTVLKEKNNKDYEILLNHYVTFTGNEIPFVYGTHSPAFEALFQVLAEKAKDVELQKLDNTVSAKALQEPMNIPEKNYILGALQYMAEKWNVHHTPLDYNNNMSSYEFAFMCAIYKGLDESLKTAKVRATKHKYTDIEKIWLMYTIATNYLPYREKHNTTRSQMPWLAYVAKQTIQKVQLRKPPKYRKKEPSTEA